VKHTGTTATPFLYNGRDGVMTDANGLYYMRARYYNPEIKRFVNQDVLRGKVASGQSLNRYAYVSGQPVSYVDPLGLFGLSDVGNAVLIPLNIASGVARATAAGCAYATGTLAGGSLTPVGTFFYAKGTSLVGASISDINDASKELNSVVQNTIAASNLDRVFYSGRDIREVTPDETEGIFFSDSRQ